MKFSLSFRPDLFTSERSTLTRALERLVTEGVIDGYERGAAWGKWSPEDEYQIKIDGPNACCYARRFEKPVATLIRSVLPDARFIITVSLEHCCTGCDVTCEREDTVWRSHAPPTPEERAIYAFAMDLD